MDYPGWGYAIIVLLISLSVLNVPIVALLRFLGILKYEKPASKPDSEGVLAPGSVTPSLSRVPLPPMEMPLAGTRDDEDCPCEKLKKLLGKKRNLAIKHCDKIETLRTMS